MLSSRSRGRMSDKTKSKLEAFWKEKAYLIIDEFSMISKRFLVKLSCNVSIGKQENLTARECRSEGSTSFYVGTS
ncbi:hypothetical protein BJV78DRAFT_1205760 [Lactifluus subvellereus]|nr:hypothetical protein BJV78DRAFT_1205760 [Lactifluus subvellereus]